MQYLVQTKYVGHFITFRHFGRKTRHTALSFTTSAAESFPAYAANLAPSFTHLSVLKIFKKIQRKYIEVVAQSFMFLRLNSIMAYK